ncbi:MAG: DUF3750 domain-containing protein [Gammaproteobacteria bacterium]|nr:DUF3750 domain-containing protein [Gammaproteobacteria bacterium]
MAKPKPKRHLLIRTLWAIVVLLLGPISVLAFGSLDLTTHWSDASLASSGKSPRPDEYSPPLVQVYGARAYNWRGAFGIHTWIATKRKNDPHYKVFQVIGWNLYRGRSAVSERMGGPPDFLWFNAEPKLLLERSGAGIEQLIDQIEQAVQEYPYPDTYHAWPGPNSNTFIAYIARRVPELGLDLPPTAIGKDYLVNGQIIGRAPSGSGWQLSLLGLVGITVAAEEGVELNLLGLSAGIDINDLALRLPGLGRVELIAQDQIPARLTPAISDIK